MQQISGKQQWRGRPYYSLDAMLRDRFGEKVYKVTLNGGMSCPNRDGTLDTRGCIFCSQGGSGDFAADPALSIREQIDAQKILFSVMSVGEAFYHAKQKERCGQSAQLREKKRYFPGEAEKVVDMI